MFDADRLLKSLFQIVLLTEFSCNLYALLVMMLSYNVKTDYEN